MMYSLRIFFIIIALTNNFVSFSQEETDTIGFNYPEGSKKNEFGYQIVGIDFKSHMLLPGDGRALYEFINSVLYRYKFNDHISLRLYASYFEKTIEIEKSDPMPNGVYGNSSFTQYKIGAGIQYGFLKKNDLLYSHLDLGYRRRIESATKYSPGFPFYSVSGRSDLLNGLDMSLGMGTKIRIYGNLFFSVEFAYNLFYAQSGQGVFGDYQFNTFTSRFYLSLNF